jgi:PAS domain S-box-containing protein
MKLESKTKLNILFLLFLIILIVFSSFNVRNSWVDENNRAEFHASLISDSVGSDLKGGGFGNKILSITIPIIIDDTIYNDIKDKLVNLVDTRSNVNFAYLWIQRNDKIYFLADSNPVNSPDISLPGDEFIEATEQDKIYFSSKEFIVTEPIVVNNESIIKTFAPIIGNITGETFAVLGVDYPEKIWNKRIIASTYHELFEIFGLLLLLILFYVLFRNINILKKTKKDTENILENANDLIQSVNQEGKFIFTNKEWCKVLEYNKEEALNLNFMDIVQKDHKEHCAKIFKRLLKGESIDRFEVVFVSKRGKEVTLEGQISALFENGKFISTQGIFRNITERVKQEKEIQKHKKLLQQYLDIIGSIVLVLDTEGNIIEINQYGANLLGYNKEELVGKLNWFKTFVPKRLRKEISEKAWSPITKEEYSSYENPIITKNGEERLILWKNIALESKGKNITQTLSSGIDITNRKIIEEKLKGSENKYREIAELLPGGIFDIDLEGNFTYVNNFLLKLLEYTKDDFEKGVNCFDVLVPSDVDRAKKNMLEVIEGSSLSYEYTAQSKNKALKQVMIYAVPIISENKPVGLRCVVIDITEKKKQENIIKKNIVQLESDKEKIETIISSIGDGLFVLDKNMKIVLFNSVASQISGFTENEVIGKLYNETLKFVYEKDNKINKEFIEDVFTTGKTQRIKDHTFLYRKDGTTVPIEDSVAPLKDTHGRILGCVIVFKDATESRRTDKMRDSFISLTSHQLRTPLTGIRWLAEILLKNKNNNFNNEQIDMLKEIHNSDCKMINLITDLLSTNESKKSNREELKKKDVLIVDFINEIINDLHVIAKERNVKIIPVIDLPNDYKLKIDPLRLTQAISNIIDNAIKYSKQKDGIVWITAGLKNNKFIFSVRDNGIGISIGDQRKIFKRFFRASNAILAKTDGTGLGLVIAKNNIEVHGGKIWFESKENEGSKFSFTLGQ